MAVQATTPQLATSSSSGCIRRHVAAQVDTFAASDHTYVRPHAGARLYGTTPRWRRMAEVYGGLDAVRRTTNVVYSNGFLDQWSSAGITGEMVDPSGGALA